MDQTCLIFLQSSVVEFKPVAVSQDCSPKQIVSDDEITSKQPESTKVPASPINIKITDEP